MILEQRFRFYRFDIHAAQGNGSGVRIPKACRQFGGGRLAAAGWAYQRRDLALLCHKGYALQNRLLIVREYYILKLNVVALVIADIGASLFRGRIDLLHTLDADKGREHFCHQHEATGEGVINAACKQQKQNKHRNGQRTGCHQNASHQHDRHKTKPKDKLSRGRSSTGSDLVFAQILDKKYHIIFKISRNRYSYLHPGRKKYITGQYLAHKNVYADYRKSRNKDKFYEEHRAELSLYDTALRTLKEKSDGNKLPSMTALYAEKTQLIELQDMQREDFSNHRDYERELRTVSANIDMILGKSHEQEQQIKKEQNL